MKFNKHEVLLVAGGAVASCVLSKVLKSKSARDTCVKTIAKGLETKDNLEHSITKMKEEAEDLYAEAVIKNAQENFTFTDEEIIGDEVTL